MWTLGSTDGSVLEARSLGVDVVELDARTPFTAARARNDGFERLCQVAPKLPYVQFVDGDCEVVAGWLDKAVAFLDLHRDVAVVCGRRRERYPARSIYNRLCDLEWDTPVGEAKACGGDALMRAEAFEKVDHFRADLIAGEEPELCLRLRQAGWRIWRLDYEMTLHDAAITRFSQWWSRTLRGGYAFANGAYLHSAAPERHLRSGITPRLAVGLVATARLFCSRAGFCPLGLGRVADLSDSDTAPGDSFAWAVAPAHARGGIPNAGALPRGMGPDQIHEGPPLGLSLASR